MRLEALRAASAAQAEATVNDAAYWQARAQLAEQLVQKTEAQAQQAQVLALQRIQELEGPLLQAEARAQQAEAQTVQLLQASINRSGQACFL